jgi:hypothetical protein
MATKMSNRQRTCRFCAEVILSGERRESSVGLSISSVSPAGAKATPYARLQTAEIVSVNQRRRKKKLDA